MEFQIQNINKSINDIMRQIGYMPTYHQSDGEFSIIRKISGNDYPRFHLYIKIPRNNAPARRSLGVGGESHAPPVGRESRGNEKTFIFNLHLDQKKPSYEGSSGHSGEYDGDLVKGEAKRIKNILIPNA